MGAVGGQVGNFGRVVETFTTSFLVDAVSNTFFLFLWAIFSSVTYVCVGHTGFTLT